MKILCLQHSEVRPGEAQVETAEAQEAVVKESNFDVEEAFQNMFLPCFCHDSSMISMRMSAFCTANLELS